MNFPGDKNKLQSKNKPQSLQNEQHDPLRLSFYKVPPVTEITLEEFERFAIDRLKLLREVETANIRCKSNSTEYNRVMYQTVKSFFFYSEEIQREKNCNKQTFIVRGDQSKDKEDQFLFSRRRDRISHFILRLAFARSEDLRRWFITQEMDLFRYRFQNETVEQRNKFLKQNNLHFNCVGEDEKEIEKTNLRNASLSCRLQFPVGVRIETETYYKVPFTDVLDLVNNRKVFLKGGFAYVPDEELISIIIGIYRTQLSQALAVTARKLPYLEEDTRLLPILKNLSSAYIGDSYTSKKVANDVKLSLNDIDQASKTSFPICMRNLHEGIRKDHHLKYFGRLQYGLFLKAAGLSLEEALIFWRTEFTQKMDVEKFEKQYAYNIRHNYGKEGKRADYTPYNCLKIITTNQPGVGDYHGCPFKHSDAEALTRRLQNYKVPAEKIIEILDLVNKQHYQVACARYFEITHKKQEETISINHPNEYFLKSRHLLIKGEAENSSTVSSVKHETEQEIGKKANASVNVASGKTEINDINMDDEMEMI